MQIDCLHRKLLIRRVRCTHKLAEQCGKKPSHLAKCQALTARVPKFRHEVIALSNARRNPTIKHRTIRNKKGKIQAAKKEKKSVGDAAQLSAAKVLPLCWCKMYEKNSTHDQHKYATRARTQPHRKQ